MEFNVVRPFKYPLKISYVSSVPLRIYKETPVLS